MSQYVAQVTPTDSDDVRTFFPEALPWRIQAVTGRVNGSIKGIGGIAMLPDGTAVGFLEAAEEDCRNNPRLLHGTAKRFLNEARAKGTPKRIVAQVDQKREAAGRWLERLGFERVGEVDGEVIYAWQQS